MSQTALRLALAYQAAHAAGFPGFASALLIELRAELSKEKRKSTLDA